MSEFYMIWLPEKYFPDPIYLPRAPFFLPSIVCYTSMLVRHAIVVISRFWSSKSPILMKFDIYVRHLCQLLSLLTIKRSRSKFKIKPAVLKIFHCHVLQPAGITSNVQCVRLAAGRRTQAGDATDQWRINENQLIFDEVKAYKKLCQVFGPPWCNTCMMWQLLSTITETINTLYPVVNFFKCVVQKSSCFQLLLLWHWHFTR